MLALSLLALSLAAAQTADPKTVREVERFVSMELADMSPELVTRMMAVDPQTVPPRLWRRFQGRCLELETYRQLAENKKRGTVRTPDKDCALPKDADSSEARMLMMAGFVEVFDQDVEYLKDTTHCTPRQMMCEFTLKVVLEKQKKGPPKRRWFLHAKDPLMALVSEFRTKGANRDTPFFGLPKPICSGS